MPLAYPSGTVAEHLACRRDAVVFDVSHLGTVRVVGPAAFDRLQETLSNDLRKVHVGRAQYTHLLDEADGSVVDDIIVWWVGDETFDVMPNASNTHRVVAAVGGTDTTADRCVLAIQGPGPVRAWPQFAPEAAAVPRFGVTSFVWRTTMLHGCRNGLHGRGRGRVCGPGGRGRGVLGRGAGHRCATCRPRGPRHAAPRGRPAAPRSRARARASLRYRPGSDGSWDGTSRPSTVARHCWPSANVASAAGWPGWLPTAGSRRERAASSFGTGAGWGR